MRSLPRRAIRMVVCDDGLGCGVGGGDAITEFFVLAGRVDQPIAAASAAA
jgi:hypothetical protein